jgi:trans-2,3-dihydro-3-hydroxyanthranilate isomerase
LDLAEVARLIGLSEDDLDPRLPPQVVSTGTAFAVVALRSAEALALLKVSHDEATRWLRERGARWFYVLGPTGGREPAWRARMQFNGGEDPATGSAAGCAISYLVERGAVAPGERIALRQGVEIGRPSDLYLSAQIKSGGNDRALARVTDVRVAGSTVLVAKGRIIVP